MYDKACYERRKNGVVVHSCPEEAQAYEKIKGKWGFSDREIKNYLKVFSVSEIFYGSYINGKFKPKDMFKLFLGFIMIFSGYSWYHLTTYHNGVFAYKGTPYEIADDMYSDLFLR